MKITNHFANLPEDIAIEIVRRLPITSIARCKCVCKSWRYLIVGDEFAMSYAMKPGMAFVHRDMDMGYTVRDEAFKLLFRFANNQFSIDGYRVVIASANGLLSVWDPYTQIIFICNPMTREYVKLPPLSTTATARFFGFGVSKISGQYKVLCGDVCGSCHVYTLGLGAGLWSSVAAAAPGICIRIVARDCDVVFFNGNLHWLTCASGENFSVCCFDLETELFTNFLVPCDYSGNSYCNNQLYILEGRLYLCNILDWQRVIIWKMNDCGDENSWIKEYSFDLPKVTYPYMYVLEVLANGDLLFAVANDFSAFASHDQLFMYSKNTRDFVTYVGYEQCYSSNIVVYTPSFISLKAMGFHNIQSLNFYCSYI